MNNFELELKELIENFLSVDKIEMASENFLIYFTDSDSLYVENLCNEFDKGDIIRKQIFTDQMVCENICIYAIKNGRIGFAIRYSGSIDYDFEFIMKEKNCTYIEEST